MLFCTREVFVGVDAEHLDFATGLVDQGKENADRGRLAGTIGSQQGEEVALTDIETDAAQGVHVIAVDLAEVTYRQCCCHVAPVF